MISLVPVSVADCGAMQLPAQMDIQGLQWCHIDQCYQAPGAEQYYNVNNSSIWQMFDDIPDWVHNLASLIPQDHDHYVASVIRIDPGQTVPLHQDKHYILQKKFGAGHTWRYLIFLEAWKSGHYFEIDANPVTGWLAGDWIKFHRDVWHLGGNMGVEPFFSAQITVVSLDKSTK